MNYYFFFFLNPLACKQWSVFCSVLQPGWSSTKKWQTGSVHIQTGSMVGPAWLTSFNPWNPFHPDYAPENPSSVERYKNLLRHECISYTSPFTFISSQIRSWSPVWKGKEHKGRHGSFCESESVLSWVGCDIEQTDDDLEICTFPHISDSQANASLPTQEDATRGISALGTMRQMQQMEKTVTECQHWPAAWQMVNGNEYIRGDGVWREQNLDWNANCIRCSKIAVLTGCLEWEVDRRIKLKTLALQMHLHLSDQRMKGKTRDLATKANAAAVALGGGGNKSACISGK